MNPSQPSPKNTRTFHITVTVTEEQPPNDSPNESPIEPTPESPPVVLSERAQQMAEGAARARLYAAEVLGQ